MVLGERPGIHPWLGMLPARKSRILGFLLLAYIRRALRSHFDRILLHFPSDELHRDEAYPLVFFGTHATWWDGFLEIPLVEHHRQDLWLMMEERNLRKFPVFRSVGVFGVDLDTPAGRSSALLYAAKRLRAGHPRRAVYLYPHGRLVPPFAEWPPFQGGVAELLRLCPQARAVPVARELVHGKWRDPVAHVALGQPLRGTSEQLENSLRECRDRLRRRIAAEDTDGCVLLLPPKRWSPGRT